MEKIQKRCDKCGKIIDVIPNEYCCPLCGEFFTEVDNEQILRNHLETELCAKIAQMKERSKWNRRDENKDNAIKWLKVLGISYLVAMGLSLFGITMAGTPAHMVYLIILMAALGCVLLAGPMIPIVNYFRYKKKLKEDIEHLKKEYENLKF